jgi:hypothetical protein
MAEILSEFAAAAAPSRATCWFTRLTPEQQDKVVAAHSAGYSAATIAKVLSGWEIRLTAGGVWKHLGGGCSCPS